MQFGPLVESVNEPAIKHQVNGKAASVTRLFGVEGSREAGE